MDKKKTIVIGIPCFSGVGPDVLDDYMRFAYNLGRRYLEYDFFLAIKGKSEQFRARNAIIEASLSRDCDYTLMLDDDHIIDIDKNIGPAPNYNFLKKLINHLETRPEIGIVGALYFQRGGNCDPVIMEETKKGQYFFKTHAEVTGGMQKVAVTGGGCMLLRKEIFDKIEPPYFAPEFEYGTDIQICKKATEAGYEVWCDTSIEIGHLKTESALITSKTIKSHIKATEEYMERADIKKAPPVMSFLREYKRDAMEFTGENWHQFQERFKNFSKSFKDFDKHNPKAYYLKYGIENLARNVCFHASDEVIKGDASILGMFNLNAEKSRGLDFGCGSAPIGFELAKRGNHVDFIDVPGSYAEDFVKWRCKKHGIDAGFNLNGKVEIYDWILFMDSIEHIPEHELKTLISSLIKKLKPGGSIITNYFYIGEDKENVQHITMDHQFVKDLFIENDVYPATKIRWVKDATLVNTDTNG
jgi:2-polyprenyl-3-methyl-5-hydroxy-6-metoxy-1,4-benzoquinol methylase|tara:strand:+ start:4797 stop:6209 length:1413 start_codon:yes stop_codon:yes gene_type:complete